jgi:hypothetical protein
MGHDTERGVEDLRELARVTSLDVTTNEFLALPPAEQLACARFGLQKVTQRFRELLDQAIARDDERHIRIIRDELAGLAASAARLDKIAGNGG